MSEHTEIERAFALDAADLLPDLAEVPGVGVVTDPDDVVLVATYLDTDDLALLRAGVTLRRRTGGADEGWHLKLPAADDARVEVRRPLGAGARVPTTPEGLVLGWTHGRALAAVAEGETHRTTRLLLDDEGRTLAELADDAVTGRPAGDGPVSRWREVEVELVDGEPDLLEAITDFLGEAGIRPSAEQRKIGTVLAHRLPQRPEPRKIAPGKPARRVLERRLAEQVGLFHRHDVAVRRGADDGVHQLRVACRRLRGALATFRPLVDRPVTDPLRDELGWLARTLGEGRDAEVMRAHLRERVEALPPDLLVGPVRPRIDRTYAERLRAADVHAREVMASARYLRLAAGLDALLAAPPWIDAADDSAADVLLPRVARDWRRLRQAVDVATVLSESHAAGASDDGALDEALHDVRKAAKRLRYACEALEPVWGGDAKALRKAAQEITRVLGARQDCAVARADLARIAVLAAGDGENGFTYGVLHERESARERELEADFAQVWERVRAKSLRAWLG